MMTMMMVKITKKCIAEWILGENSWKGTTVAYFISYYTLGISSVGSYAILLMRQLNYLAGIGEYTHPFFDIVFSIFSIVNFVLGLLIYLKVQYGFLPLTNNFNRINSS